MPSRAEVRTLLDQGLSVRDVAARLDVAPGLVHLLATGRPADGSDGHPAQNLMAAPPHNPKRNQVVLDWMKARAARELTQ